MVEVHRGASAALGKTRLQMLAQQDKQRFDTCWMNLDHQIARGKR